MSIENPFPPPSMNEVKGQSSSLEVSSSLEKGPYYNFEKHVPSSFSFADELAETLRSLTSQCDKTEELWLDIVKTAFYNEFIESYKPTTQNTIQIMQETESQIINLKNRIMELDTR
jgi:hypothetical protein